MGYRVIHGQIVSSAGHEFDAYTLYPSATPASQYTAIKNYIAYQFPEKVDW
mgnify:CR=1 FL=1